MLTLASHSGTTLLGVPFLRGEVWGKHQWSSAQSAWVLQVNPQLTETMNGDVLDRKLYSDHFRASRGESQSAETVRVPFPF